MLNKAVGTWVLCVAATLGSLASESPAGERLWAEDFEAGWGAWFPSQGVWEVGTSSLVPARGGSLCAGTILGGNYPNSTDTRLIGPQISLPSVTGSDRLRLKFWQWLQAELSRDFATVEVSTDSGVSWTALTGSLTMGGSQWTRVDADLTPYAGQTVQLGFHFTSNSNTTQMGWYLDDLSIERGPLLFNNPEDFEEKRAEWTTDVHNSVWEIGEPSFCGPPPSGDMCAATRLNGNYINSISSRLISPEAQLPSSPSGPLTLRFWHCYSIELNRDFAYVQISANNGPWQTIAGAFTGSSAVWTPFSVDLSSFAGSAVRVAFLFTTNSNTTAPGWFVDDVSIVGMDPVASWTNYGEGWAGTTGTASLYSDAVPRVDQSINLTIENSRGVATLGLLLIGASSACDLTTIGSTQLVSPSLVCLYNIPPGGLTITTDPIDPGLEGQKFFLQMVELDPGAIGGLAFSDGLRLNIGN
jgi:hypothetical protein